MDQVEVTKLVQSEELHQKLLIGKFLIKLNTAIRAHKWFDGDSRSTFHEYDDPKAAANVTTNSLQPDTSNFDDPHYYDSIQSVSSLLLHERPGICLEDPISLTLIDYLPRHLANEIQRVEREYQNQQVEHRLVAALSKGQEYFDTNNFALIETKELEDVQFCCYLISSPLGH